MPFVLEHARGCPKDEIQQATGATGDCVCHRRGLSELIPIFVRVGDGPDHRIGYLESVPPELPGVLRAVSTQLARLVAKDERSAPRPRDGRSRKTPARRKD